MDWNCSQGRDIIHASKCFVGPPVLTVSTASVCLQSNEFHHRADQGLWYP
jgi:hypothetical protein